MIIVWTMRRQAVAVHCLLAVTFLCWGSVNGVCESVEATTGFLYSCELAGNDFPAASSTGGWVYPWIPDLWYTSQTYEQPARIDAFVPSFGGRKFWVELISQRLHTLSMYI